VAVGGKRARRDHVLRFGFAAQHADHLRALFRRIARGCLDECFDVSNGLRQGERLKFRVVALQLRDGARSLYCSLDRVRRKIVGGRNADLFAIDHAHAHLRIGLRDVLMDDRIGKARERRFGRAHDHLGLIRFGERKDLLGDFTNFIFAKHSISYVRCSKVKL
jgi:hypothetical protein